MNTSLTYNNLNIVIVIYILIYVVIELQFCACHHMYFCTAFLIGCVPIPPLWLIVVKLAHTHTTAWLCICTFFLCSLQERYKYKYSDRQQCVRSHEWDKAPDLICSIKVLKLTVPNGVFGAYVKHQSSGTGQYEGAFHEKWDLLLIPALEI